MKRSIFSFLLAVMLVLSFSLVTAVPAGATVTSAIEVSQPVQVTSDSHYERGQSIVYDGTNYWLFYGRSVRCEGWYQSGDPDLHDYEVYYKKAASVADLAAATPTLIPGANNQNGYLGETGAAYVDGNVWAFATIDIGATADLYGWYTDDSGSTWTEVGPLAEGLSEGAAHHDEIGFDGKLYVMVNNPDALSGWYTKYTDDPTASTITWSSYVPLADPNLVNGLGHFLIDGTDLYIGLLRTNPTIDNKVLEYTPDPESWTELATIPSTGWDPTLFKVGTDYVFAQAPCDSEGGGRQYIVAWTGTTLSNVLDGSSKMVSAAKYGTNTWGDMWPIGFTDDNGDSYLFFTSERDEPAQEGTGNIWYIEVDWDTSNDHFTYIQSAIDNVVGTTITVAAGTYDEAIVIDKALTLRGANADVNPVTEIRGAESIIDAGGADRAVNILSYLGVVTFDGFTVRNFANQGICHRYDQQEGTTVHVLNNIVRHLEVSLAHGNSIQVSGDRSTVIGNDVTGARLESEDWAGTAILVVAADSVEVRGNFVHDAEKGIGVVGYTDWGGPATNTLIELNTVQDSRYGITIDCDSQNTVIRYNDVLNNGLGQPDGSGIESQSYWGFTPRGTQIYFNNIVGNLPYGVVSYEWVDGEPIIASPNSEVVNADVNYWGDISGPQHEMEWDGGGHMITNPGGTGDPVSDKVDYIPWLTRDFQTVLDDNICYFGIPMVYLNTGWNTLSTPIALDPACATWGGYKELGDGLSLYTDPDPTKEYVNAYSFLNNGEVQGFVEVGDTYRLRPCDAIYVRMAEPDIAAILWSPDVSISSKDLYAGWNLVSYAGPPELNPGYYECRPADEVLRTVYFVPGDLNGYKLVVNPPVNFLSPYTYEYWNHYWRGGESGPPMCVTLGYWVLMNNDGTLAGLSSTPIPLPPGGGPLD